MRLIDADELIKGRAENDPVVIAAKCATTAYDLDNSGADREIDRLYAEKCKELAEIKENYLTGIELANIAIGLKKLREYEDLEEQGKLLKLPCAVGDRIYRIDTDEKIENKEIEIYDIDNIVLLADGTILLKYDSYDGVICHLENIVTDKPYLDFYRCFLSQEEAEAALEELRGKRK